MVAGFYLLLLLFFFTWRCTHLVYIDLYSRVWDVGAYPANTTAECTGRGQTLSDKANVEMMLLFLKATPTTSLLPSSVVPNITEVRFCMSSQVYFQSLLKYYFGICTWSTGRRNPCKHSDSFPSMPNKTINAVIQTFIPFVITIKKLKNPRVKAFSSAAKHRHSSHFLRHPF